MKVHPGRASMALTMAVALVFCASCAEASSSGEAAAAATSPSGSLASSPESDLELAGVTAGAEPDPGVLAGEDERNAARLEAAKATTARHEGDVAWQALVTAGCRPEQEFVRCDDWPNLLLLPPVRQDPEAGLVFVDFGGPGIDTLATAAMGSALVGRLDSSWLAFLVEEWTLSATSVGCSASIDSYLAAARYERWGATTQATAVADRCGLAEASTDPAIVARQLAEVQRSLTLPRVGAVAASFGSLRVSNIDRAGAGFDAILVDSPILTRSGSEFVSALGSSVERYVLELIGVVPEPTAVLESTTFASSRMTVDFTEADIYLALYVLALNPDSNEEWARRVFVDLDLEDNDVVVVRSLADAMLRHDGFEHYEESWRGHLADICRYLEFDAGGAAHSPASGFYSSYFSAIYSPCDDVEQAWTPHSNEKVVDTSMFGCIVARERDPVSEASSLDTEQLFVVSGTVGHAPFGPSYELDVLFEGFWDRCEV